MQKIGQIEYGWSKSKFAAPLSAFGLAPLAQKTQIILALMSCFTYIHFRYIMFSRYWTEIIVIGILPLLALICLNYGIYLKIRKSVRFRKLNDGFAMRFTSNLRRPTRPSRQGSPTQTQSETNNDNNGPSKFGRPDGRWASNHLE